MTNQAIARSSLLDVSSFVIVDSSNKAILEVFNTPNNLKAIGYLKPEYKATPIGEYLGSINGLRSI